MVWSLFFHVQMGNLLLERGSEHLPGWFVHFLVHCQNCLVLKRKDPTDPIDEVVGAKATV